MNPQQLHELKMIGHTLLDEYCALDHKRKGGFAKQHAYEKLDFRLGGDHPNHFGMMTTEKQVRAAIFKLHSMISRRKKKIRKLGLDKIKFAPNLMEIQKNIHGAN